MEQVDLSHPITEDDIANFLLASPDFFERHAEVLASIQLASPHGNRAVGLQQRQAEMLREKIKALESRIVDMVGHAHDNAQLADKVEQLCCELLHIEQPAELPARLISELARCFDVPQVGLRLWDVDARFADSPFVQSAGEDAQSFAESLDLPFCGPNPGLPLLHWLGEPDAALSLALIPLRWPDGAAAAASPFEELRPNADEPASEPTNAPERFGLDDPSRREPIFVDLQQASRPAPQSPDTPPPAARRPTSGLLLLAAPDAKRFHPDMGTDFLQRLADLCGAALSRLRPIGPPARPPAD